MSVWKSLSKRPTFQGTLPTCWKKTFGWSGPCGTYSPHLVFKGGTSLSRAYDVIQRFSEDVDLTYDIRAIAADLIGDGGAPLPVNRSQER